LQSKVTFPEKQQVYVWPAVQVFGIVKKFFTTLTCRISGADKEKLPPQTAPSSEILALKEKMANSINEIRNKSSALTVQELKRLLFRCAATLIAMQKVCDIIIVKVPFSVFSERLRLTALSCGTSI
jgi:hypothetical protein